MFKNLKREWGALRHGQPGHRFEARFEANQGVNRTNSITTRLALVALALVSFVIGVILVFIPGPAILFFAITGGLLAAESRWLARQLDRAELRIRALCTWGARHWRKLHVLGKTIVIGMVALAGGAMAYASYRVLVE